MAASPTTMAHPDNASAQSPPSIASDIIGATRPMHTKINKLITSRLPLALPPRVYNASPYVSGLLHLLPVYMTFEQLWVDILDTPPVDTVKDQAEDANPLFLRDYDKASQDEPPAVSERVHGLLKSIYVPQLFRSDRLKADIKSMTGWSDEILEQQIHAIKGTGQLSAFISHIKQAVRAKPHILIAYSYNLFMALFAGGRFIRAAFENVDAGFWNAVPAPIKPTMQPCEPRSASGSWLELAADPAAQEQAARSIPLEFWRFDSDCDGEDLKQEYKGKLLMWEDKLSAEERNDVIQESVVILESIGQLVSQLDAICGDDEQDEKPEIQMPMRPSLAGLFGKTQFGARLRDSLLVARERGVGNSVRNQSFDAAETEQREAVSKNSGEGDAATGVDVCPGVPKSMRFAKSLPIPSRRHGRIAGAKGGSSSGKLRPRTQKHQSNASMVRSVLVGAFGLFILYYLFARVREIMS